MAQITENAVNRDVVVIGASAGGVTALMELVADLPETLDAAVLIVLHIRPDRRSLLDQVLGTRSPLPVVQAEDGMPLVRGRVYVPAPDQHLLVTGSHVHLRRGPRENASRPAIDPLFRSAAVSFSSRVVGVVLTGCLNDGAAGLRAIKRCGGVAVVQDPLDAEYPEMPRSALRAVEADHVVPLAGLAPLLETLTSEPAGPWVDPPEDVRLEALIAAHERTSMDSEDKLGTLSPLTCPECHGTMWEIHDGPLLRYRCHTGHAYTAESLAAAQLEIVEDTLSNALRAHNERAELLRRFASRSDTGAVTAHAFKKRAEDDAETLRQILLRQRVPAEG